MSAHQRTRAFPIQIEVAHEELFRSLLQFVPVLRIDGPRQPVIRVIGDGQRFIKTPSANYREDRAEDFLLGNARSGRNIRDDGWLDKVARPRRLHRRQ